MKSKKILTAKTYNELLDIKYGKIGTSKRKAFERKAKEFVKTEIALLQN